MHPVTLILRRYCNSQNTIHMCKHCLWKQNCRHTHQVDMTTDAYWPNTTLNTDASCSLVTETYDELLVNYISFASDHMVLKTGSSV